MRKFPELFRILFVELPEAIVFIILKGVPMIKRLVLLHYFILMFFVITVNGQEKNQSDLTVTIYNEDLGVVRDIRNLELNAGKSEVRITDVAQRIDATSVRIKFDGEVIEQNYQYDLVSMEKILHRYIDKKIQLINEKGELLQGTLLSVFSGQIVLRKDDGGLLMLPSLMNYRINVESLPEGLITKPTLQCLFDAKKSGKQNVEFNYMTGGFQWTAEYVAVLDKDDKNLDLKSWVSITNNSGTTYKNAKVKLIAGDINRVREDYIRSDGFMEKSTTADFAGEQFEEKSFFEYHLYTLGRPTTLANNETKQISLFERSGIKAVKKYLYMSNANDKKVNVVVEFVNSEANGMGVPMPRGKVRVYKADGESLELIGEDKVEHTPKDERVSLKIGDAFDVVAEEIQTDYDKISDKVYEVEYKITLKNRKTEDISVNVRKGLGYFWEVLKTTHKYEKVDASNVEFVIPVTAGKEAELIFRVRYQY